jgi:hypothetical protein
MKVRLRQVDTTGKAYNASTTYVQNDRCTYGWYISQAFKDVSWIAPTSYNKYWIKTLRYSDQYILSDDTSMTFHGLKLYANWNYRDTPLFSTSAWIYADDSIQNYKNIIDSGNPVVFISSYNSSPRINNMDFGKLASSVFYYIGSSGRDISIDSWANNIFCWDIYDVDMKDINKTLVSYAHDISVSRLYYSEICNSSRLILSEGYKFTTWWVENLRSTYLYNFILGTYNIKCKNVTIAYASNSQVMWADNINIQWEFYNNIFWRMSSLTMIWTIYDNTQNDFSAIRWSYTWLFRQNTINDSIDMHVNDMYSNTINCNITDVTIKETMSTNYLDCHNFTKCDFGTFSGNWTSAVPYTWSIINLQVNEFQSNISTGWHCYKNVCNRVYKCDFWPDWCEVSKNYVTELEELVMHSGDFEFNNIGEVFQWDINWDTKYNRWDRVWEIQTPVFNNNRFTLLNNVDFTAWTRIQSADYSKTIDKTPDGDYKVSWMESATWLNFEEATL